MRYRIMGTPPGGKEMAFVVVADTIEEARHKAHLDRIVVRDVSPIDETAERGERMFVGSTVAALLMDLLLALSVVGSALAGLAVRTGGGRLAPWAMDLPWQAIGGAVFFLATTVLLAQAAYAGSLLGRRLVLAWAGLQCLVTLPVVVLIVVGLVGAVARGGAAVPWGVLLPVPALRLGAYGFRGDVVWRWE